MQIVSPILEDTRTKQQPGSILGHIKGDILDEAIGWGQADFSEPWRDLDPSERALLYAFFNQPGHIDELLIAFHQLFHSHVYRLPPVLIDVGCGPFTAGLAYSAALPAIRGYNYIGIDRAKSMTELGESLALAAGHNVSCQRIWAHNIRDVAWPYGVSYREVIVIASYLLASATVDIEDVVDGLTALLNKISLGASCILYTNSAKTYPNRRMPDFEKALFKKGFKKIVSEIGKFNRSSSAAGQERELRYALYVRQELDFLPLGTD
jgi:hypothetical protein